MYLPCTHFVFTERRFTLKIITDEQIRALGIPLPSFYGWVVDSLKHKASSVLPPKTSLHSPGDIFFNTMPCILPYKNVEGVKMVNRYPGRRPSIMGNIVLHNIATGELKAIMDAEYITSMRTGAVAAHSIKLLARQDYRTIGMIGLGATANATLDMLLAIEPGRVFTVKLYRYKDHAQRFMEKYCSNKQLQFIICDDYDSTIKGSDVIISCVTVATQNFCADDKYDPGAWSFPSIPEVSKIAICFLTRCSVMTPPMSAILNISTDFAHSRKYPK